MPYSSEQTAYTFFEVSPTAGPYEIDNAYRAAIRRYPPDRVWDSPMASVSKTGRQDVERWYSKISTPDARQKYDAMLAEKQQSKPVFPLTGLAGPDPLREANTTTDDAEARKAANSKGDMNDNPSQEADYNDNNTGEQADDAENADRDDDGEEGENNNNTPPPNKSIPITLESLDIATAKPYLYRTRTRTLLALAVLWLAILVIVYGTPSTWPLYIQVSSPPVSSPYATLGLPEDAFLTPQQIRAAYHRAVLAHHPDKPSGGGDATKIKIVEVNSAYETLREPYTRCLYEQASLVQAWVCLHLKTEDEVDEKEKDVEAGYGYDSEPEGGFVGRLRTDQVAVFSSLHNLWQQVWHRLAKWLGRVAGC